MIFTVADSSIMSCSVALHLYSPPWEGRRGLSMRVSCVVPLPLSTTLPLGASHSTVRPSTDSSLSSDTLHTSVYSAPAVNWPSVEMLTCSPAREPKNGRALQLELNRPLTKLQRLALDWLCTMHAHVKHVDNLSSLQSKRQETRARLLQTPT